MSRINTWNEPFLPWVESENDRRFKRILRNTIIIAMILGVIVGYCPRTGVTKEIWDKTLQAYDTRRRSSSGGSSTGGQIIQV